MNTINTQHSLFMNTYRTLLAFLLFSLCANAEKLQSGENFPVLSGQDQHEVGMQVEKGTRHVVVTFTMGVGKKANKYFAGKGAAFLEDADAVLVNDIFGMPSVGRVFALPKMRKYPHRIFVADAEGLLEPFPNEDGKATVFDLDEEMRILDIRFWDPSDGTDPF